MTEKKSNDPMKQIDQLREALFGVPEEIDADEANEILQATNVDFDAVRNRVYERLRAEAQPFWMEQKELPVSLKRALEEFRPETGPIRSEKELEQRASSKISRVFEAAKARITPNLAVDQLVLSSEFRNEKEQKSAKDQETIDLLEKELLKSIEEEKGDHSD